ncbi:hypothetical protein BDW02DRAFT_601374 [Decorospora gaudefroyi]|uniref:Uncharacterized protein n=1 Tax=Decorospora gaudefroyi TaxID=184978 RepID=A0A6A5K1B1_9PLEO|nr:hypothetical protein BDW02DRAFT_601374 [Decorospora gaudefroyi]
MSSFLKDVLAEASGKKPAAPKTSSTTTPRLRSRTSGITKSKRATKTRPAGPHPAVPPPALSRPTHTQRLPELPTNAHQKTQASTRGGCSPSVKSSGHKSPAAISRQQEASPPVNVDRTVDYHTSQSSQEIARLAPAQQLRLTRKPTRFTYSDTWKSLSIAELQDEAQIRGLSLVRADDLPYLVDIMILNDRTFAECYYRLEDRQLNVEQLRDEAIIKQARLDSQKHYNVRELLAAIAAKAGHVAVEELNGKIRAKESEVKQAAVERRRKKAHEECARRITDADVERNGSNPKDSGYSSTSISSTKATDEIHPRKPKGKKRARSEDDDDEGSTPNKRVKAAGLTNVRRRVMKPKSLLPRGIQARAEQKQAPPKADVKIHNADEPVILETPKVSTKATRERAPAQRPPQVPRRRTRSNFVIEDSGEDSSQEDTNPGSEENEEDDDWLVEDMAPKPKRKSGLSAMDRSDLFSGMR